jgi:cysteine-rich repeat protein
MDYGLRPPGCGNGALDVGEKCDDQNLIDGDGCSSNCTIEAGWVCWKTDGGPTPCKLCGDGIVQRGEECDDGNRNNGDGCNSQCAIELSRGVRCNLAQPSVCWIDPTALNVRNTRNSTLLTCVMFHHTHTVFSGDSICEPRKWQTQVLRHPTSSRVMVPSNGMKNLTHSSTYISMQWI